MLSRVLSSISGLYPPDASSTPSPTPSVPVKTSKMSPDITECPWDTKSFLIENHCMRAMRAMVTRQLEQWSQVSVNQ